MRARDERSTNVPIMCLCVAQAALMVAPKIFTPLRIRPSYEKLISLENVPWTLLTVLCHEDDLVSVSCSEVQLSGLLLLAQ